MSGALGRGCIGRRYPCSLATYWLQLAQSGGDGDAWWTCQTRPRSVQPRSYPARGDFSASCLDMASIAANRDYLHPAAAVSPPVVDAALPFTYVSESTYLVLLRNRERTALWCWGPSKSTPGRNIASARRWMAEPPMAVEYFVFQPIWAHHGYQTQRVEGGASRVPLGSRAQHRCLLPSLA